MMVSHAGVALHIGEEVISNAFIDLDVIGCGSGVESSSAHSKITTEALPQLSCKKRKRVDVTRNLEEHPEGVGLEVQVPENNSTSPTPLKIAALEALETLLTVVSLFCMYEECCANKLSISELDLHSWLIPYIVTILGQGVV